MTASTCYYVDAAERSSGLWRQPLAGGAPTKIVDGVINGAFDVVERGIYYIDRVAGESFGYFSERQTVKRGCSFSTSPPVRPAPSCRTWER